MTAMQQLPAALAAMGNYRQFIVYMSQPSRTRPGKIDKFPCDYRTGHVADAHDPNIWTDHVTAIAAAARLGVGYGLGFVFTESDPFWFLDLDNCLLPDGTDWTPVAKSLCSALSGCAVEVSQSMRGLHVFGSGPVPAHACKNLTWGMELYHSGRFVALTGHGAVGDCAFDASAVMSGVVAAYFAPGATTGDDAMWTTEPDPEWCGPTDDGELIRRALRSRSVGAAFGARASFADLWNADVAVLGKCYPDEVRAYDASSADAALAQHLAFWAGKDCARVERLMRQSQLARDKWEREDYLPRTIIGAVSRQMEVFVDEAMRRRVQIEQAVSIGEGSDVIRLAGEMSLDAMLPRFVFIQDGQQVVDLNHAQHVSALADWKAAMKASVTSIEVKDKWNVDGSPVTKCYETTALWEKSVYRQVAMTVTFKAGEKRVTRDPETKEALNTWSPIVRTGPVGDPSLFLEHINYLFGVDAERFLDWLAHIEQHPGELPHHGWLHISDTHGTGRNWIASVVARLWPGYAAINFDLGGMLHSGFNGRLSSKLIAVVDEIREGGTNAKWENAETMKRTMTEEHRTINPKYGRQRVEFNACRWLIFSNHIGALTLDDNDRRFNVVRNEAQAKGASYYSRLYAALKDHAFIVGVADMLAKRDLSEFNPGAHAVMNEAKEAVVDASRSDADKVLLDLVKCWPCDVITSSTLGELITGQVSGTLTRAHGHALARAGIKMYHAKIRVGASVGRISILRNADKWKDAHADMIKAELAKAPQIPFGGAKAFLENLT